jgi:hypothetical protein
MIALHDDVRFESKADIATRPRQGLRQQRFDEPAILKQRRIGPRIKFIEHYGISAVIEYRTDRSYEDHEFENVADVPTARPGNVFRVDVVGWNCRLRKVIEQIIGEYLDRRHREKWQKQAGAEYTEHVAEIRTRPHFDILGDIAEDLTSFDHAVLKYQQAPRRRALPKGGSHGFFQRMTSHVAQEVLLVRQA